MAANLEVRREEIHSSILRWLEEEGTYKVKKDSPSQGMYHLISVNYLQTNKPNLPFTIQFPTSKKDLFQVAITISIPKIVIEKLSKMADADLNKFHWDLTINLIRTGCFFQSNIGNNGNISTVSIWEEVYYDGTTKDRFIQAIRKVINGYTLVAAQFEQLSGEPRPRSDRLPGIG